MDVQRSALRMKPVLRRHGVVRAGLFGSRAVGQEREGSDVDVLVEMPEGASLLDLIGLKQDLEEHLSEKVDVVTYRSLHPLLKESILAQEVRVL